jgi:CBS domain containing-hemolysin-like protein
MTALLLITAITLSVSALCSLFEAVLYSTRIGTLEAARHAEPQDMRTEHMLRMKRNVAQPITAILVLNTIANTAGANLAGVMSANVLGSVGVAVFPVFLVLGILFLSELIPKTAGAIHWRRLWPWIAYPLFGLRTVLLPVIWMIEGFTRLLTHGASYPSVTEDEILAIVKLGASEGHISEEEGAIVRNIIHLENKHAKDIMTPRVVAFTVDAESTVTDALERLRPVGFSRIPMFKEHPENITGYVLRRELYSESYEHGDRLLQSMAKPISFVPETANCLTLLNQFLKHRRHIAMVADEYGGVAGLITLEDLLETALGSEIIDETDRIIDMQTEARERGRSQARNLKSGSGPDAK